MSVLTNSRHWIRGTADASEVIWPITQRNPPPRSAEHFRRTLAEAKARGPNVVGHTWIPKERPQLFTSRHQRGVIHGSGRRLAVAASGAGSPSLPLPAKAFGRQSLRLRRFAALTC